MAFRVALTYTGFHVGCPDWHRGLRVVLTLTPVSNRGFLRNVLTYTGIKQGFRVVMTCTKDLLVVLTYTSIKQGFSEKCPDLRQDQRGLSWLTQGIKSCLDLHQCHQGFSEKCPDLCWDQTGFQVCPNLHKGSRVVLTYTSVKRFFPLRNVLTYTGIKQGFRVVLQCSLAFVHGLCLGEDHGAAHCSKHGHMVGRHISPITTLLDSRAREFINDSHHKAQRCTP